MSDEAASWAVLLVKADGRAYLRTPTVDRWFGPTWRFEGLHACYLTVIVEDYGGLHDDARLALVSLATSREARVVDLAGVQVKR